MIAKRAFISTLLRRQQTTAPGDQQTRAFGTSPSAGKEAAGDLESWQDAEAQSTDEPSLVGGGSGGFLMVQNQHSRAELNRRQCRLARALPGYPGTRPKAQEGRASPYSRES